MTPQELKSIMSHGLLSFPLTDFDANGDFYKKGYIERLEWLAPYGASALFAAGGTGEFFSLTAEEYPEIIKTAVETCKGKVPIIAGAGGPIGNDEDNVRLGHAVIPVIKNGAPRKPSDQWMKARVISSV